MSCCLFASFSSMSHNYNCRRSSCDLGSISKCFYAIEGGLIPCTRQSCEGHKQVHGWQLNYLEFHYEQSRSRLCLVNLWLVIVFNKANRWLPIIINVVSNGERPKPYCGYVTKTSHTCRITMTKCSHSLCKPMTVCSHQK